MYFVIASLFTEHPISFLGLGFGVILAAMSIRLGIELLIYTRNERHHPGVKFNSAEHYRIKEEK